jgi:hypothetical protein
MSTLLVSAANESFQSTAASSRLASYKVQGSEAGF